MSDSGLSARHNRSEMCHIGVKISTKIFEGSCDGSTSSQSLFGKESLVVTEAQCQMYSHERFSVVHSWDGGLVGFSNGDSIVEGRLDDVTFNMEQVGVVVKDEAFCQGNGQSFYRTVGTISDDEQAEAPSDSNGGGLPPEDGDLVRCFDGDIPLYGSYTGVPKHPPFQHSPVHADETRGAAHEGNDEYMGRSGARCPSDSFFEGVDTNGLNTTEYGSYTGVPKHPPFQHSPVHADETRGAAHEGNDEYMGRSGARCPSDSFFEGVDTNGLNTTEIGENRYGWSSPLRHEKTRLFDHQGDTSQVPDWQGHRLPPVLGQQDLGDVAVRKHLNKVQGALYNQIKTNGRNLKTPTEAVGGWQDQLSFSIPSGQDGETGGTPASQRTEKPETGGFVDLVRESQAATQNSRGEALHVPEASHEQEMGRKEPVESSHASLGREPASTSYRRASRLSPSMFQGGDKDNNVRIGAGVENIIKHTFSESSQMPPIGDDIHGGDQLRHRAAGFSSLGTDSLNEGRGVPDVPVVILDDDDDDEDEFDVGDERIGDSGDDMDSDAGSLPRRAVPVPSMKPDVSNARTSSYMGSETSSSDDDTDDDDCQVLGSCPPQKGKVFSQKQELPRPGWSERQQTSNGPRMKGTGVTERESDSSDVEVMGGSQNNLKQHWEEAALRRRTGQALQSENSQAGRYGWRSRPSYYSSVGRGKGQSTYKSAPRNGSAGRGGPTTFQGLAESVATSTDSEDQFTGVEDKPMEETRVDAAGQATGSQVPITAASVVQEKRFLFVHSESPKWDGATGIDFSNLFTSSPSGAGEMRKGIEEWYEPGEPCSWTLKRPEEGISSHNVYEASTSGRDEFPEAPVGHLPDANGSTDLNTRILSGVEPTHKLGAPQDLIGDREKMKQSADFKLADEEEWAQRQLELQRQAQEVQRLRKRKRAEADRKSEMENRQKQRLAEIRQTQQKEEWNMGLKEQVRGQVQNELERLASGCIDMATLLRRLQIPVEGGPYPSPKQVNAAYKKALLRFHPDRASSALAQGDPRQQVEAEETFKLISRMKNTVSLVASPLF